MTNGEKKAVVVAIGLIILVAFGIDFPQQVVETTPAVETSDRSHYYEKVEHVELKDGSYATITSRDTSSTSTIEE